MVWSHAPTLTYDIVNKHFINEIIESTRVDPYFTLYLYEDLLWTEIYMLVVFYINERSTNIIKELSKN